jgi:hypothetical protein
MSGGVGGGRPRGPSLARLACKSMPNPTLQRVTAILLLGVFLWLAAACAYNQPTAGWSFGGIVTMFAISRSPAFALAIDQASGALTWDGNPQVRSALMAAAEQATTPMLLMVAQNDRTTASITTLADIFQQRGMSHRMTIYAPFTPDEGIQLHRLVTRCSRWRACRCGERMCSSSWAVTSV